METTKTAVTESALSRIRKERCQWCALNMPIVPSIRRMGAPPIHEVSQPGSNSDDYESCTAPSAEQLVEELAGRLVEAERDTARLNVLSLNTGGVSPQLLNGNDEDDEFPEGFVVEMVLNNKAYTAENTDLRDALDELLDDAARAQKESTDDKD